MIYYPKGRMTEKMISNFEDLCGALAQIEDMYRKDALSDEAYYQCMVTLASEFLCAHHDAERALVLLNKCAPAYFDGPILEQMRADELYAAAALQLTYHLYRLGLTGDIVTDGATQGPAEA